MDKIKTRNTVKDIKVLNKAAYLASSAKNVFVHTKEQADQMHQTSDGDYVEYAGNRVKDGTQTVVQKAGQFAQGQGKKTIRFVQNRMKPTNRSGGKTLKKTAKNMVKTSRKTVKTAGNTIKTSQTAVKTAARTAQTAARTAQRAIQAARAAAIAAKTMVKAVVAAVKVVIAVVRSLIALIAAGGWVVIVIILIICIVGFLIKSSLGIFFSDENKDANVTSIANVVQEVNSEFNSKIEAIKTDNPDVDSIEMDYPGSADNTRIDNWMDVVAVFAVKTAMDHQNGMDVATIDNTRIDHLKSAFWDMNSIGYKVETVEQTKTVTVKNDDGTTSEKTVTASKNILHIIVTSKTVEQQAEEYGFKADQREVMKEMLSELFRPMMFTLLGIDNSVGLTPDQLQNLYNNLPPGQFGAQIVRLALSRLGDPYSQPNAGQGDYTDCSYLTQWCYGQAGIFLPRTAAEQAKYCVDNHFTISPADLQPGDLVFFSLENNGRFMNISHVAICVGNGYIVDASSSRGQVVYRKLFGGQVLYGRP